MSKSGKLAAGLYIILQDYSDGRFPPTFEDQARAYEAEIQYADSQPGVTRKDFEESHLRKPFWGSAAYAKYSTSFSRLLRAFEQLGLNPKCRLLELGCGAGWTAEFLAVAGYSVLGTSIGPLEIALANKRAESVRAKGLGDHLSFKISPMESVDAVAADLFDGVFVFEALHHAFDWRKALRAAYRCLEPRGWLLLANEPNRLHTFIAYRVARISNTHEVGFSRKDLLREIADCGFSDTRVLAPRVNNGISPHWIAARK